MAIGTTIEQRLSQVAHAALERDLRVMDLLDRWNQNGGLSFVEEQELTCYAEQSTAVRFALHERTKKVKLSFTRTDSANAELTPELIRRAVDGNTKAQKLVIKHIGEIVRQHVIRGLGRYSRRCGRDPLVYADDYFQITLLHLWDKQAYRLLAWDPEAGSARAYFGTITRHCVIEKLVSRNQSHQTEEATPSGEFEEIIHSPGLKTALDVIENKDLFEKLYEQLGDSGSEREIMLFDLLYRDGVDAAEAARVLKLSMDALHQAKCRLLKRLKQIADILLAETK